MMRSRFPLMGLSLLALLGGLWAGLVRIGWALPVLGPALPGLHGPLMISGFLGTLISLERAVALKARWSYAAPLLSGFGGAALIVGGSGPLGGLLITLGSAVLAAIFAEILRRQRAWFVVVMVCGALAWLVGNIQWLGGAAIPVVVPWLAGFLVLTIVGERLELSRLTRPQPWAQGALLTAVAVYLLGLAAARVVPDAGWRIAGLGMLGMAVWLWRYDVTRRTIRQPGLTRFIAASLLAGYCWLGIGGILWVVWGGTFGGLRYDALLHAVFLGFVFSMIFAHAPIILPAVLGGAVPYRPSFYLHVGLLHVSLVMRLAGDLGAGFEARRWGGLLAAAAILLFLVSTLRAVGTARRARSVRSRHTLPIRDDPRPLPIASAPQHGSSSGRD